MTVAAMGSDFQQLDGHPDVSVRLWDVSFDQDARAREVQLRYLGQAEALIAAGAADSRMFESPSEARGAAIDEDGDPYDLKCQGISWRLSFFDGPTWQLTRRKPLERALRLPGAPNVWAAFLKRHEAERVHYEQLYAPTPVPPPPTRPKISKDRAVEISLDHVVRALRARLEPELDPKLDWLPETTRDWSFGKKVQGEHARAEHRLTSPRPAWSVYIPGEELHVGAGRIVRIDAETGEILSDRYEGE